MKQEPSRVTFVTKFTILSIVLIGVAYGIAYMLPQQAPSTDDPVVESTLYLPTNAAMTWRVVQAHWTNAVPTNWVENYTTVITGETTFRTKDGIQGELTWGLKDGIPANDLVAQQDLIHSLEGQLKEVMSGYTAESVTSGDTNFWHVIEQRVGEIRVLYLSIPEMANHPEEVHKFLTGPPNVQLTVRSVRSGSTCGTLRKVEYIEDTIEDTTP